MRRFDRLGGGSSILARAKCRRGLSVAVVTSAAAWERIVCKSGKYHTSRCRLLPWTLRPRLLTTCAAVWRKCGVWRANNNGKAPPQPPPAKVISERANGFDFADYAHAASARAAEVAAWKFLAIAAAAFAGGHTAARNRTSCNCYWHNTTSQQAKTAILPQRQNITARTLQPRYSAAIS